MSDILEQLFKFPMVMIDGESEEKKEKRGESMGISLEDAEVDIIIGEAECPYYDFLSITDRWMPNKESLERAISEQKFDACYVIFLNSGGFLVPWNKKKFKDELKKFTKKFPKEPRMKAIEISKEEALKLFSGDEANKQ